MLPELQAPRVHRDLQAPLAVLLDPQALLALLVRLARLVVPDRPALQDRAVQAPSAQQVPQVQQARQDQPGQLEQPLTYPVLQDPRDLPDLPGQAAAGRDQRDRLALRVRQEPLVVPVLQDLLERHRPLRGRPDQPEAPDPPGRRALHQV